MVMAGGSGTRLWPLSRRDRPKQLVPMPGGRTLLAIAMERLGTLVEPSNRLVCTGESFRGAIHAVLPALDDAQILGEPEPRDTLNAIGLTAAVVATLDPEAVLAVLTADHLIEPEDAFRAALRRGFEVVESNPSRLVTFGIEPTHPATGYGYVERGAPLDDHDGAWTARRFVEKPDLDTAKEFLEAGTFSWNSGMFVYAAAPLLAALERFQPAAHEGLTRIAGAWDTPDRDAVLSEVYPDLPRISVDYGLMEPASTCDETPVCIVPMAVTWRDVGTWSSLGETLAPDDAGCRASGLSAHLDSRGVLTISDDPDHLVATVGCEDLVVVHTADVTLVCPAAEAQRVKALAESVDDRFQ